jgi:hypothetical protein
MRIKIIGGVVGLAALVWLLFGFFGVQALFMDKVVEESVTVVSEIIPVSAETVSAPKDAPAQAPKVTALGAGEFEQGDSTYTISGTAKITESNGVRTLSLVDFEVTNGPDLFVYIVSSPSTDNQTVKQAVGDGKFINISALKGNIGNQNYVLPPEVKIDENSVVSIWCRRFFRNFGSAKIQKLN